jgi:cardiolipin synthase
MLKFIPVASRLPLCRQPLVRCALLPKYQRNPWPSLNLRRTFSTPTPNPNKTENIYTIPNILTVSRIIACPVLGYAILDSNYAFATGLLVYAGLTDLVCPARSYTR